MEFNQIIITDANLPLLTDEFFEEFADYTIFSYIDLFSDYNHVEIDKKHQNHTTFIITLILYI